MRLCNEGVKAENLVQTEPNEDILVQNNQNGKHAKSTRVSQTSKPKEVNIQK